MTFQDFFEQAIKIGIGGRCIAKIGNTVIRDCRLQVDRWGSWHICNDLVSGDFLQNHLDNKEKLGYTKSYAVRNLSALNAIKYIYPKSESALYE